MLGFEKIIMMGVNVGNTSSLLIILSLFLLFIFSGCQTQINSSDSAKSRAVSTCVLPADQGNQSIIGMWLPIYDKVPDSYLKVYIDPKFKAKGLDGVVKAAVDTWNNFSSTTYKLRLMDYSEQPATAAFYAYKDASKDTDVKLSDYAPGNPKKEVYIYYVDSKVDWDTLYQFDKDAVGVTLSWWATDSSVRSPNTNVDNLLLKSSLFINYSYFFNGDKPVDLQSVVVHELGHVIGLDHSCGPVTAGDPRNHTTIQCPSSLSHPYLQAVMYWQLQKQQVKRDLYGNDQERLNCMYGH